MTLTYFTAKSNLVTEVFLLEKVKTVDFSETIAASDTKVGRCRQLLEFMKVVSIEGQGHFLTLAQRYLCMKIKTCFSQKPLGRFNQFFM